MACWRLEVEGAGAMLVYESATEVIVEVPLRGENPAMLYLGTGAARKLTQAILDAAEAVDGIKAVVRVEGGDG